jgi:hypothetical protein
LTDLFAEDFHPGNQIDRHVLCQYRQSSIARIGDANIIRTGDGDNPWGSYVCHVKSSNQTARCGTCYGPGIEY